MWTIIAIVINMTEVGMRTVQMTLDDDLVKEVDRVAKEMKTTRSAFTRAALQAAIRDLKLKRLEKKHRKGYERYPAAADEFDAWHDEQAWGEE